MGSSVARSLILIYKSGGLGWLKDVCLSGQDILCQENRDCKFTKYFPAVS